jgi:glyoxylase I family protein
MKATQQNFILGLWGVRYQVKDVQRSIAFYTQMLGFKLDHQNLPAFGQVSISNLKLILSGPGASGSRPTPDGRQQEPGGWNRVVLQVEDLPACIADLKKKGVNFRNEMEVVRAANRFKWKILTAIRSSCSSLHGNEPLPTGHPTPHVGNRASSG